MEQIGLVGRVGPVGEMGSDDLRWDAVMRRDRGADGRFVYAVTSTGVFCRPSCASRRPRRERVRFFDTPAAALAGGFRACLRCRPTSPHAANPMEQAISRAAAYLAAHADDAVPLARLAAVVKVSASHLQREFKKAIGVSPREYQAACRADRFRAELRNGRDVTGALYEAGYGSPSRVYETPPTGRGLSPSSYRAGAAGEAIGYSIAACALGRVLVAATAKGICAVRLGDSDRALEAELRQEFPRAQLARDRFVSSSWLESIVQRMAGGDSRVNLPLDVRGTAFQWQVWRALQAIPAGETRSYADVAAAIGRPSAVRAVARACATNPVCVVVPCHRVVAKDGRTGGYRWGADRKTRLLAFEADRKADSKRKPK